MARRNGLMPPGAHGPGMGQQFEMHGEGGGALSDVCAGCKRVGLNLLVCDDAGDGSTPKARYVCVSITFLLVDSIVDFLVLCVLYKCTEMFRNST